MQTYRIRDRKTHGIKLPVIMSFERFHAPPKDTPSEMPSEKKLSNEKPEKKPSDYQSAVAAESKRCAMAYSDNSFRVVHVCPLSSKLEIVEAL